jgi:cobalt-zinc-cadmium efflux system membrane fusion protein
MIKPLIFASRLLLLASLFALFACSGSDPAEHGHDHDHGHGHAEDDHGPEGPNGGRLIGTGKYAVELKIEESATPRFVAWGYENGKLLPADQVRLEVRTERLGGQIERFSFAVDGARLLSRSGVGEPHSFIIEVEAAIAGETIEERYDSFEGRTTIDAKSAQEAGIVVATASAGDIVESIAINGVLVARRGGEAAVAARFPGVVRRINAEVGDRVSQGQTLAIIESDASLADYPLRSPITGTVIAREARVGEATGARNLFAIADLQTLWLEMRIFGSDAARIKPGAKVRLTRPTDGATTEISVAQISPVVDAVSQSLLVNAVLKNSDGIWRPGMAVRAYIETQRVAVPLRVPVAALQKVGEWDAVFVRVGDIFEARPLTLGRRNEEFVEVLSGLAVGEQIVVEQSFLIKADIEKSGAVHDH